MSEERVGRCVGRSDDAIRTLLTRVRVYLEAGASREAGALLRQSGWSSATVPPVFRGELLILTVDVTCALGDTAGIDREAEQLSGLCRRPVPLPEEAAAAREGGAPPLEGESRIRALSVLASFYCARARYSEALLACDRIDPADLVGCAPRTAAGFWHARWLAHLRRGELEQAEAAAAGALARAESDREIRLQGTARAMMATTFKARGRLTEAVALYNQAALLHRRAGDLLNLASDQLNRGWALNRIGLLEAAAEAFREVDGAADGFPRIRLRGRIGAAVIAIRQGRPAEARRGLLSAWRGARARKNPRDEALALEFLAEALVFLARPASAARALRMCRRTAERLSPCGDLLPEIALREALLAMEYPDSDKAGGRAPGSPRRVALDAVRLCRRAGLPWEEAQARRLLAAAFRSAGHPNAARRELARALQLLETMGEQLEIRLVRRWIAFFEENGEPPGNHVCTLAGCGGERDGTLEPPLDVPAAGSASSKVAEAGDGPEAPGSGPPARGNRCPARGSRPPVQGIRPPAQGRTPRRVRGPNSPVWARLGLAAGSRPMLRVLQEAEELASGDANVLLLGETGTGKDLLARGLHLLSGRTGSFVPVNCGACPPDLFESEIFGVERGAFTGADRSRPGLARTAEEGTLFLDEVGDLERRGQTALLRFLDSGEIRPLGSTRITRVRLGVISATWKRLADEVGRDRFRGDLYYRLGQEILKVPPLRERPEDLPLLCECLWRRRFGEEEPPGFLRKESVLAVLRSHSWPGNIRELERFVANLGRRVRSGKPILAPGGDDVRALLLSAEAPPARGRPPAKDLERALALSGGNRSRAAGLLGVSRAALYRMLKSRGLAEAENG